MGFVSLLLTVGQGLISNICIPKSIGATWHPCNKKQEEESEKVDDDSDLEHRRRLLSAVTHSGEGFRRVLAAASTDKCAEKVRVFIVDSLLPYIYTHGCMCPNISMYNIFRYVTTYKSCFPCKNISLI